MGGNDCCGDGGSSDREAGEQGKYKARAITRQLTEIKLGQTVLNNMDEIEYHVSECIS